MRRTKVHRVRCGVGGKIPYREWRGIGNPSVISLLFPKTDECRAPLPRSASSRHRTGLSGSGKSSLVFGLRRLDGPVDIGCDQFGCLEELLGMGQPSGRLRAAASLRSPRVSSAHAMALSPRSARRSAISGPASTMDADLLADRGERA